MCDALCVCGGLCVCVFVFVCLRLRVSCVCVCVRATVRRLLNQTLLSKADHSDQ